MSISAARVPLESTARLNQTHSFRKIATMAKSKQQKQKDREKRVKKEKLALAAKRRELAKQAEGDKSSSIPRAKKGMAEGLKQPKPQVQSGKPTVTHRRTGG